MFLDKLRQSQSAEKWVDVIFKLTNKKILIRIINMLNYSIKSRHFELFTLAI